MSETRTLVVPERKAASATRSSASYRRADRVTRALTYLLMSVIAIVFLAPMVWSAIRSFTGARASATGAPVGIDNYLRLADFGEGVWTYTANSLIVAVLTVAGTLVVSTLAGYGFARFSFPGKNILFLAILAILMVPHPTILIPLYKLLGAIGLQNSLVGLALVMIMFQLPFAVFLMRNSFESLPRELEESALIDGCTQFGAFRRVLLPIVAPGMITVAIFAFLASWNEFMAPLILISDGSRFTLPIALVNLRSGDFGTIDVGALQAGIVVAALPCIVVFLALQRHYVRGFTSGAVKG